MRALLAMAALAAAVTPAFAIDFNIGKIIDYGKKAVDANKDYTEEQEIALGEGILAGFLGAAPLSQDANLQRYVNRVGRWLALHSDRPDLPWTFAVIETDTINAFAFPGGNVVVSTGLLKRLGSESELAGVLAHEIAHVVKKHQLAAIKSGGLADLGTSIAQDVASDRIGRSGGGVAAQQLKSWGANAGLDLVKKGVFLRPLDRGLEYDADQLAIVIATRSGYDPYGLVGALQMLAQYKGETNEASLLSTHPAPADRLAELEKFVPTIEKYSKQPQLLEARYRQNVK